MGLEMRLGNPLVEAHSRLKDSIMKGTLLLLILGFVGVAPGQDAITLTNKLVTFTDLQGRAFRDVRLVHADKSGIVWLVPDGIGGGRFPYTNLPPAFLESLGIPTNWTVAAVTTAEPIMAVTPSETEHRPTTSRTNAEAKVDREDELELVVKAEVWQHGGALTSWCLTVKVNRLLLTVIEYFDKSDTRPAWTNEGEAEFAYSQKGSLKLLLEKFLEWEAIASKNHTESFEKAIVVDARLNPITEPKFRWEAESGSFGYLWLRVNGTLFGLDKKTAQGLLGLLERVPAMQEELAQKIHNRKLQKDLFR